MRVGVVHVPNPALSLGSKKTELGSFSPFEVLEVFFSPSSVEERGKEGGRERGRWCSECFRLETGTALERFPCLWVFCRTGNCLRRASISTFYGS